VDAWRAKLEEGDTNAAWDLFIARYRPLILATIRRTLGSDNDVMEVFADVCGNLSANDLERPKSHRSDEARGRFTTWLAAVVHNQTIDWVRRRDGRPRLVPPTGLTPIQEEIFEHVFVRRRTHAETYELVRTRAFAELTFASFLKEVAHTYRAVQRTRSRRALQYSAEPRAPGESSSHEDAFARKELAERLDTALAVLHPDERLAVQLFVVDGMEAAEVARTVNWPNAKAVYNRVYRALRRLREQLQRARIGPTDV
jgi:RNA polymerase sigma factor (sigma-70 family)